MVSEGSNFPDVISSRRHHGRRRLVKLTQIALGRVRYIYHDSPSIL